MKHPPKCAADGCTSMASVLVIRRWLMDNYGGAITRVFDNSIKPMCDEHSQEVLKASLLDWNHETTIRRLKK